MENEKKEQKTKKKKHLSLFFLFLFFNWCHMCGCQTTNTWLVSQAPSYQHQNNFFKFTFFLSGVPSIPKLPCKTSFRHFLENPPTYPSQNVKHSNIKWHFPQGRKLLLMNYLHIRLWSSWEKYSNNKYAIPIIYTKLTHTKWKRNTVQWWKYHCIGKHQSSNFFDPQVPRICHSPRPYTLFPGHLPWMATSLTFLWRTNTWKRQAWKPTYQQTSKWRFA